MSDAQQPAPKVEPVFSSPFPGIRAVTGNEDLVPQLLVIAREKEGKSATAGVTLVGYDNKEPLFYAFDSSGPNSCLRLGYRPKVLDVNRLPGVTTQMRNREGLKMLETNPNALKAQFNAIIVDCGSTMVDRFHEDARRTSNNPDPRSHYGDALLAAKETMHRLAALGLPVIWLSWLKEAELVEEPAKVPGGPKSRRMIPGGPNILGNFRTMLAGRVMHTLILEKQNVGVGAQGADEDGFVRVFHTRDWQNIRGGGRFSHLLAPQMQANMGAVLWAIKHSQQVR
jgi:hypothetical protein